MPSTPSIPRLANRSWSQPYMGDSGSIIMTPIHFKNDLFIAGFNNRNMLLELSSDKPGCQDALA